MTIWICHKVNYSRHVRCFVLVSHARHHNQLFPSYSVSCGTLADMGVMASPVFFLQFCIFLGFQNDLDFMRVVSPTSNPQQSWMTDWLLHRPVSYHQPAWHGRPYQKPCYCLYGLVDCWNTQIPPSFVKVLQFLGGSFSIIVWIDIENME